MGTDDVSMMSQPCRCASFRRNSAHSIISGFARSGYPQQLRIVLGIAKPVAAIVLLLPRFALLKEWAYAGATFAWIMAFIAAYASGDPLQVMILPPVLLALLAVSYLTRPPARRVSHRQQLSAAPR